MKGIVAKCRSRPMVIFFTSLARPVGRFVIESASAGLGEIVASDALEATKAIEGRLDAQPGRSGDAELLCRIAPRLRWLREPVARSIVAMCAHLPIPASVADWADSLDESARQLEREVRRAGFSNPHDVLAVAQLVRSWSMLCASRPYSLEQVAEGAGYRGSRTLIAHYARYAGRGPRSAARQLTTEDFVSAILARVLPPISPIPSTSEEHRGELTSTSA